MTRLKLLLAILALSFPLASCGKSLTTTTTTTTSVPVMRWDHRPEATNWTSATIRALKTHGTALPGLVPKDIETWCPAYPTATTDQRMAFWAGLLSTLAKYESTWKPEAAGGGGKWLGLLQIAPATARGYGCRAQTASALYDGAANLSCGIRIMSRTVPRDGVIAANLRGAAADWTPFRKAKVRAEMAAWTASQDYCIKK